jgi:hypothetical protein
MVISIVTVGAVLLLIIAFNLPLVFLRHLQKTCVARKRCLLLERGVETMALIVDTHLLAPSVNFNVRQYGISLRWSFKDSVRQMEFQVLKEYYLVDKSVWNHCIAGESFETIIYLPYSPSVFMLRDEVLNGPTIQVKWFWIRFLAFIAFSSVIFIGGLVLWSLECTWFTYPLHIMYLTLAYIFIVCLQTLCFYKCFANIDDWSVIIEERKLDNVSQSLLDNQYSPTCYAFNEI